MAADQTKRVPGTLIVAGIGATAPFEALLADLGGIPERLILIEPTETPGGAQAQGLAGLDGVELIDGVLAEAAGPVELVRYNLPGLRGLQAPTEALRTLFPGLKERARIPTRTVAPAEAFGDPAALPAPLRLRIDLPGAEPAILHALDETGALEAVEMVSIRCAAETPFEGGQDRAQLQSWLGERDIRLDHANEDDPDWPELRLSADPAARRIAALEAELAEAQTARATLESDLARAREEAAAEIEKLRKDLDEAHAKAEAEAEKLRDELSRTTAQLKARETELSETAGKLKAEAAGRAEAEQSLKETRTALDEARKQAEARQAELAEAQTARATLESDLARAREEAAAEIEKLRKDLDEAHAKAEAEAEKLRDELSRTTAQLKARETELSETAGKLKAEAAGRAEAEQSLKETRTALEEARKQAEARQAELAETEAARATLESDLARAREEAETQAARLKEQETACTQAYKERDKAFADLGLAMRMQGLMQSDLDDLRDRYRQSEETRATQEELLRKLTPRLQDAARQLRQLQLEAAPDAAPEALPATRTATKTKSRATATRKRTTRKKTANGK